MMDKSSMACEAEENALTKRAVEMKGSPKLESLLMAEARADGFATEADAIVAQVMKRLQDTETGKKSSTLGKGHDPAKRLQSIQRAVKGLI